MSRAIPGRDHALGVAHSMALSDAFSRWLLIGMVFLSPISSGSFPRFGYVTFGIALSALLLPLTFAQVWKTRLLRWAVMLFAASVAGGALLVLFDSAGRERRANWVTALTLPVAAALTIILVRAAVTRLGIAKTAVAYGLGCLLSPMIEGLRLDDPWWVKTNLAWAFTVVMFAVVEGSRRVVVDVILLIASFAVAIYAEYRGMMLFVAIGFVILVASRRPRRADRAQRRPLLRFGLLLGAFLLTSQLFEHAAFTGLLGDDVQRKSIEQVVRGGTLLGGARIETPAALALFLANPLGYGPGLVADSELVGIVFSAIGSAQYTLSDGVVAYVNRYMLGDPIRLHSVIGDLWFNFGLAGLAASAILLVGSLTILYRAGEVAGSVGLRTVLAIWAVWDCLFSPIYSNLLPLSFVVALLYPLPGLSINSENTVDTHLRLTKRRPRSSTHDCVAR